MLGSQIRETIENFGYKIKRIVFYLLSEKREQLKTLELR